LLFVTRFMQAFYAVEVGPGHGVPLDNLQNQARVVFHVGHSRQAVHACVDQRYETVIQGVVVGRREVFHAYTIVVHTCLLAIQGLLVVAGGIPDQFDQFQLNVAHIGEGDVYPGFLHSGATIVGVGQGRLVAAH
jgi:hypothetical protein